MSDISEACRMQCQQAGAIGAPMTPIISLRDERRCSASFLCTRTLQYHVVHWAPLSITARHSSPCCLRGFPECINPSMHATLSLLEARDRSFVIRTATSHQCTRFTHPDGVVGILAAAVFLFDMPRKTMRSHRAGPSSSFVAGNLQGLNALLGSRFHIPIHNYRARVE